MHAQESKVASETVPRSAAPKGPRLVIRVKITPEPPPAPPRPSIPRRALGISVAVVALLTLGWVGISSLRDDSASTSMSAAQPDAAPQRAAATTPSISNAIPSRTPADTAAAADVSPNDETRSAIPASSEPASPEPINEVIPDTPRSALQTITGTIRIAIRVEIDKAGAVIAAHSQIPGPSRYFERLAREAAMEWTFTPTSSDASRVMLLRFYFKREGVTAEATPPK